MDAENSMRQAPMTVNTYLIDAINYIDQTLGKGYAEKHPELIGHFIQASALDFLASRIDNQLADLNINLLINEK